MNDKELAQILFEKVEKYDIASLPYVKKAYKIAYKQHDGQKRQSGEPYIIHPISVAIILADLKVDANTICAGLLHDTVEDTDMTVEKIEEEFNKEVAILVDGVTKINKINFSSKDEEKNANIRKLLINAMVDIRIFLIKIADRLHNMRTLEFKSEFKQKENSIETLDLYVPIAYKLGVYRIMHELQDLSFYYINRDLYKEYEEIYNSLLKTNSVILKDMSKKISDTLNEVNILNYIKIRTKNIYGIYNRMKKGVKLADIHDLNVLKIMVNDIDDCYRALRYVHQLYLPKSGRFKDYIASPKTNMYQSLHTNIFGEDKLLVQAQIRTFDMDEVASFGLAAYWNQNGEKSRDDMQKTIKEKLQFCKTLEELDKIISDNKSFVEAAKKELFDKKIYVYSDQGNSVELPEGATVIDFAYIMSSNLGNNFKTAIVNEEIVDGSYVLKDNDVVTILTDSLSKPKEEWAEFAKTSTAKKHIYELTNNSI